MKKISRFLILAVIFSLCFIVLYSLFPSIVWVFGGSFKEVSQSVPYVIIGGGVTITALSIIFSETFDENFLVKP